MSIVKRITLEVNPYERPFKEGETLFTYARRILMEANLDGAVLGVTASVDMVDVSTYGQCGTVYNGEIVEITVRTKEMP